MERALAQSIGAIAASSVSERGAPSLLSAMPGRVLGLEGSPGFGLTRLGLSMLVEPAKKGMVAALDMRGWLCPLAAWEMGIDPDRLVVVRCRERRDWPRVAAALLEGFPVVLAEAPTRAPAQDIRRLSALARARRSSMVLISRGGLSLSALHLLVEAIGVRWEGVDRGHGVLMRRLLTLRARGKGVGGMEQVMEVEDDGTHPLRVVPRLGATASGRAAG